MAISGPSQAILIERIGGYSHDHITTLLKHANLEEWDPGAGTEKRWNTKSRRISTAIDGALTNHQDQRILFLIEKMLNELASTPDEPEWVDNLRDKLRSDGYALLSTTQPVPDHDPWRDPRVVWKVFREDAESEPLSIHVTVLEIALNDNGLDVALNHYRQAVASYTAGALEASNGQLRSFIEALYLHLAHRFTKYSGSEAVGALQGLHNAGKLLPGELNLHRGLWEMSQQNGAHPGTTDAAEALFRLGVSTQTARFLIHRLLK